MIFFRINRSLGLEARAHFIWEMKEHVYIYKYSKNNKPANQPTKDEYLWKYQKSLELMYLFNPQKTS